MEINLKDMLIKKLSEYEKDGLIEKDEDYVRIELTINKEQIEQN